MFLMLCEVGHLIAVVETRAFSFFPNQLTSFHWKTPFGDLIDLHSEEMP